MAALRCPQCNLPLTEDETPGGICPICGGLLPGAVPTTAPVHPPTNPSPAIGALTGPLLALGAVVLVVLGVGVYLSFPPPAKETPAQAGNDPKTDEPSQDNSKDKKAKKEPAKQKDPEKLHLPQVVKDDEHSRLTPEILPAPRVEVDVPTRPIVVVKQLPEKLPPPKVVLLEKKDKGKGKAKDNVKDKGKQEPVPVNGEILVGNKRILNRPEGTYDLGVLVGHGKKMELTGQVKTLTVPQVLNGFQLTITNLTAQQLTFGRIEGHGVNIMLSGKVKKLTINSIVTGSVFDATKLQAEEIVFSGRMEGWTKVKLNGSVKHLRLDMINTGATLEVLGLDAETITFGHRLDGHSRVTLSGKVKKLQVQEVHTGTSLDALQLTAQHILFAKRIDGHARVKVSAPNGAVEFRERVEGGAHLDVMAPGGKVTFTEPTDKGKSGSKIDGDARVTITAKEAEFRGLITGNNTRVVVTLTESGVLRFREIAGNIRLQYRKANPNHPEVVVETGLVRARAKVEKIQ